VNVQKQTEIVLAWELYEQGWSKSAIARRLGRNRETIIAWIAGVEKQGLKVFLAHSCNACKKPRPKRQVDALVKRHIWAIREREQECCGQKIAYFLEKEYGEILSVPKIYEVLAERYVLRKRGRRNLKRGPVPEAHAPREVVQMDTVMFGEVFAFTSVDIFSREAEVLLLPALTAEEGIHFLRYAMAHRFDGHVRLLQVDGGSEFKGEFPLRALLYCQEYRVARPYKKNEQAYIESFNRTLRKECLGWGHYRRGQIPELMARVSLFLERYHYHRPHLAFDPMRPPLPRQLDNP